MANIKKGNPTSAASTIDYNKSYMTPIQHLLVYIACVIVLTCVLWVFYHSFVIPFIIAAICGVFVEKQIAEKKINSRKKQLRLQFKDMLQSMSVSISAGGTELSALESAYKELMLTYNENADIMVELNTILLKYKNGGIPLRDLFADFGQRSGIDDIESFAAIFEVIEGKSNRFGEIIRDTYQIISDKIEIEQEIETTITSAKSEAYIMLIMPVVITQAMSMMGSDLTGGLYHNPGGIIIATIAVVIFLISFLLSQKFTDINV
ncbi:MAG: type II secretion system F family protein [Oscillospiraceae bacterium]|nr:type II secretion system F family protein [Oscillospiraceae bacterium]